MDKLTPEERTTALVKRQLALGRRMRREGRSILNGKPVSLNGTNIAATVARLRSTGLVLVKRKA